MKITKLQLNTRINIRAQMLESMKSRLNAPTYKHAKDWHGQYVNRLIYGV